MLAWLAMWGAPLDLPNEEGKTGSARPPEVICDSESLQDERSSQLEWPEGRGGRNLPDKIR